MSKFALGAGTTVTAAATTVVATAGAVAWFVIQEPETPESPETPEAVEVAQPVPEVVESPTPKTQAPEPTPEAEAELPAPSFDVVQVEEDGQTLVAGVAAPGETVDIVIDNGVAGSATADGDGRFVAFLNVEPSDDARVMELRANPGENARASDQTVIISPFGVAPEPKVAALAPAPTPEAIPVEAPEETVAETPAEPVEEATVVAEAEPTPEPSTALTSEASTEPTTEPTTEPVVVEQAETAPGEVVEPESKVAEAVATVAEEPHSDPIETVAGIETVETAEEVVSASEPQQPEVVAPEATQAIQTAEVAEPPAEEEAIVEATPEVDPEPTAPAVLLADADGVQVLQSPEPLVSVALDSITYDQQGEVSLGGRSTGDGFVRVYLDDRPITVSRIAQDGRWRTELPSVDTGVYQLRVDELDDDGNVRSRIETPFKREEPELVTELQAEQSQTGVVEQDVMTVQPGATLWAIARERYGEGTLFVKVFEANKDRIRDPNLIYPGQVFDLPN